MRRTKFDSQFILTLFSLLGIFIITVSSAILPYYATVVGENYSETIGNIEKHFSLFTGKEYLLFFDFFMIPFTISSLSIVFALLIMFSEKFKDKYYFLLKIIFIFMVVSIAYLYISRSIVHFMISIGLFIVVINYVGIRILNRKGEKETKISNK